MNTGSNSVGSGSTAVALSVKQACSIHSSHRCDPGFGNTTDVSMADGGSRAEE